MIIELLNPSFNPTLLIRQGRLMLLLSDDLKFGQVDEPLRFVRDVSPYLEQFTSIITSHAVVNVQGIK